MKLMRKNDLGLMKTEQKLQVSEKRITMKPKNTIAKEKSNTPDPRLFLSAKEKRQWDKLPERKKRFYVKKGNRRVLRIQNRSILQNIKRIPVFLDEEEQSYRRKEEEKQQQATKHVPESGTRSFQKNGSGTERGGADSKTSDRDKNSSVFWQHGNDKGTGGQNTNGSVVQETAKIVTKAAKKTAEFYEESLSQKEATHEEVMKEAQKAYLNEEVHDTTWNTSGDVLRTTKKWTKIAAINVTQITGVLTTLLGIVFSVIAVLLPFIVVVALISALAGGSESMTAEQDPACYLSAKYESHGDCGAIGSGGMGEYGFDKSYSLVSFVEYCYTKDPVTYAVFEPFLNMSGSALYDSASFRQVWKTLAEEEKYTFEADQTIYTYEHYFMPAATLYTSRFGYDFVNAPDAVKACVTSFSIRDGAVTAARYFEGTTFNSTAEDIIKTAYGRMQARRPLGTVSGPRWVDEEQDCLNILNGTLDIYEPHTSPSGYGGIDWSWKRRTSGIGNERIVELALSKVGCRYSQADRDAPGAYDCSSLVYRLYAEIGITYMSGMTAAAEAQYLDSHGMSVTEEELQPGDLIFYSYTQNGRYKNISHVAIYIGDGKKVHARGKAYGVVCDDFTPSNIGTYGRPQ
ncbi:MAG: NlpC/P60 family protein [Bacillota bacterium]|nr:NlpC/P60 family protein [Bacillota bacterium]